jgi:ribose-phosphate pyrophosphokinase
MGKIVIAGSSVPKLAREISRLLNCDFDVAKLIRFPDGELQVQVDSADENVIYVQTMAPRPNEMLMEMLLTIDLLRDLGAKQITAAVPYLGYTRSDYRSSTGNSINIHTLFTLLESVGVKKLVSVDIHTHRLSLRDMAKLTSIKLKEATAFPLLAKSAKLEKPLVIAPDVEAKRWAKAAAKAIEADYDVMEKKRISPTEVEIKPKDIDVKNKDVLIVDDIVSTGNTVIKLAKSLRKHGAKRIYAAFTHAVLSTSAVVSNMYHAGINELISTNTIPNEFAVVDVSSLIAEKL